jgi:hypothetical protein
MPFTNFQPFLGATNSSYLSSSALSESRDKSLTLSFPAMPANAHRYSAHRRKSSTPASAASKSLQTQNSIWQACCGVVISFFLTASRAFYLTRNQQPHLAEFLQLPSRPHRGWGSSEILGPGGAFFFAAADKKSHRAIGFPPDSAAVVRDNAGEQILRGNSVRWLFITSSLHRVLRSGFL